jgi:prophage antirepressor-like protein
VTRDVLPAIRKDGMYVMGEEKTRTGEMSLEEMTLKVLTGLQGKLARMAAELAEAALAYSGYYPVSTPMHD